MKITIRAVKTLLLSLTALAMSTVAFAQSSPDILLYSSDFTDWKTISGITSNVDAYAVTEGAGAGFTFNKKPEVQPAGSIGPFSGYYTNASSTHAITTPTFNFVNGGVLEITYYVDQGSASNLTVTGADYVRFVEINDPSGAIGTNYKNIIAGGSALGDKNGWFANYLDWFSGNSATVRYQGTYYTIRFSLPASSFTGAKSVTFSDSKQTDKLVAIKLYNSVGSVPYVAASEYANAEADGSGTSDGYKLTGDVNGDVVSGSVAIKGFNISNNVTVSLEGTDAAKFSLPTTSFSAADVLAGTNVPVQFTPSVKSGVANALLKITNGDNPSQVYYVNLFGVTGSATPQIVAPTSTLNFWTYQLGRFTQTVNVSGINLTNPITATLSNNVNFAVSSENISVNDATKGVQLNITFTGDITEGELPATLTLASSGAPSVTIPLNGITTLEKPETYSLSFSVSPTGSGYIEAEPGGTIFAVGTSVTATVTPEKGYTVASWSDNAGTKRLTRTFTIGPATPQSIVCNLTKGETPVDPTSTSSFISTYATDITTTSMTVNWTPATDSSTPGFVPSYTVTLTPNDGSPVQTVSGISGTSHTFTGLSPNVGYSYKVTSNSTESGQQETSEIGPFYTAIDSSSPSGSIQCGDENYVY